MPETEFFRALALMEQGDILGAETTFLALSRRYPHYSGPWTNLGLIAAARGDDEVAQLYFERAVAVNSGNAVAMAGLGTLCYRRGDHRAAMDWSQRAIASRPDYADAHLNLAVVYDKVLHQREEAIKHYRRYQQLTRNENLAVAAWILELEQNDSRLDYKVVSQ